MLISKYFKPTLYTPNIFEYDFEKLKTLGIKNILIDLDNTISAHDSKYMDDSERAFLDALLTNFNVVIVSNNHNSRVRTWVGDYKIDHYGAMRKPFKYKFKKVMKNHDFAKENTILIGDQILTDVGSANRLKIKVLLVEQKTKKDIAYTKVNRVVERMVLKRLAKKKIFNKKDSKWV